jgi:hypothetical protein
MKSWVAAPPEDGNAEACSARPAVMNLERQVGQSFCLKTFTQMCFDLGADERLNLPLAKACCNETEERALGTAVDKALPEATGVREPRVCDARYEGNQKLEP